MQIQILLIFHKLRVPEPAEIANVLFLDLLLFDAVTVAIIELFRRHWRRWLLLLLLTVSPLFGARFIRFPPRRRLFVFGAVSRSVRRVRPSRGSTPIAASPRPLDPGSLRYGHSLR